MKEIIDNLKIVHATIATACEQAQREASEVKLLCVSKTKPLELIKAAYACGERHFGESYISEAVDKITALKAASAATGAGGAGAGAGTYGDIVWHFIGPIQSNKTKHIAAHFDVVESVDRLKIVERLNEQRPLHLPPLKLMVQVNISHEEQKQGCSEAELPEMLAAIAKCANLELIGLMGVGRIHAEAEELKASFGRLRELREQYQALYPTLKELSMGMSDDLNEAIAMGSTEVRIGTAIFGARNYGSV